MKNIKEKQVTEALKRMILLGLSPKIINDFKKYNKIKSLNQDFRLLLDLNNDEKIIVSEFEKENSATVYYIIYNETEFGRLYSFLYVSNYEEEWAMDIGDIMAGYPLVYVKNLDADDCSEFGSIVVKNINGIIFRIG